MMADEYYDGAYTGEEIDAAVAAAFAAAPQTTTYTKNETNALLAEKASLVDGKVPAAQLPSYVDDVLEYNSTSAFPATGESGKIYVASDTNRTYRWGGSAYVEISESLALGETASTAYPGNNGKANADAIAAIKDGTNIDSFADVETALSEKLNTSDVDTALSSTSTNPVQNKVIQSMFEGCSFFVDTLDKKTFTFTIQRRDTQSRYHYGLFVCASTYTPPTIFFIFVDTTNVVTIAKLAGDAGIVYTGSIVWNETTGTLTITSDGTSYGGIRGIWFD